MQGALILALVATAHIALAVPTKDNGNGDLKTNSRYVELPGGDGKFHTVDLEAEPNMEVLQEIEKNPANNLYILFTRNNLSIGQTLVMDDANSILNSNFNPNLPTIVVAAGWLSNQNSGSIAAIKYAYLFKSNVNVIVVDWSRLAVSEYNTASGGVPAIGRGVGQFLLFLNRVTGASFDQLHLIGFDLGAHLVGIAGRAIGSRAARVTGLDPNGLLWLNNPERMTPNDGVYVEVIHTDGRRGGLGIGIPVGNADFFVNASPFAQPGCVSNSDCSHNRAWELFVSTVINNHLIGIECVNDTDLMWDTCHGQQFHMGNDDLRKWGTGIYRVVTSGEYPY